MQIRRSAPPLGLAVSLLLLGPGLPPASSQLLGPEFPVNSHTAGAQWNPAVASDGSGNFVVIWQSIDQDGSNWGVFGQRFNSVGGKVGSEFRANSYTENHQAYPAVATDGSGNFVVVWQSNLQDGLGYGVFGQRYDSAGTPVGSEFRVNSYTTNHQQSPGVAADGSGNFVVVWHSNLQDGSYSGVFGQRFNSAGVEEGSEFRVNTYITSDQNFPAVAADDSGNFVVVWTSYSQDGSGDGVFRQRYDSAGTPVGGEFRVNSYTTSNQRFSNVAADGSGNFVLGWESSGQDGSNYGVFGRRFNSAGSAVGSEFRVNSYTTSNQRFSNVAADGSGNFVVAWSSSGQDGSTWGVFGQRFNSVGSPVGREFQVNSYTTNLQYRPAIAADGSGNFVVAWTGGGQDGWSYGVFGQRLAGSIFSDGFEAGNACAWSAAVGGGC